MCVWGGSVYKCTVVIGAYFGCAASHSDGRAIGTDPDRFHPVLWEFTKPAWEICLFTLNGHVNNKALDMKQNKGAKAYL